MADRDDNKPRSPRLPEVSTNVTAAEKEFDRALRAKEEARFRFKDFLKSIGLGPGTNCQEKLRRCSSIDEVAMMTRQEFPAASTDFANDRLSELHVAIMKAEKAAQAAERAYLGALEIATSPAKRH
jgi:hypothetical protein